MAMLSAHLHAPVPRVSEVIAEVPAWVDIAVSRALAKDPAERWATIADFGHALLAGAGGSTTVIRTAAAPGGLLSTYDLGERLGRGRLDSVVYRGTHRALGHPVAIRLLRRDTQRNWEGARARFMREAQTLQVAHPSIIQVRDYGEESDFGGRKLNKADRKRLRKLKANRRKQVEGARHNGRRRAALSQSQRAVVLNKTGRRCHICGGKIQGSWDADHVLAYSVGGVHLADNYLPAHSLCNNYRWHYSEKDIWNAVAVQLKRDTLERDVDATTVSVRRVITRFMMMVATGRTLRRHAWNERQQERNLGLRMATEGTCDVQHRAGGLPVRNVMRPPEAEVPDMV
jgi:hypothetical protein